MPKAPACTFAGALAGNVWPAIPQDGGAQLLAMQFQFERSQWWSAEQLTAAQDTQLDILLRHAAATVPYYQRTWAANGFDPRRLASADFSRLPILSRADVQAQFANLQSLNPPPQHGAIHDAQTSGSLGMPLCFRATQLHDFFWHAITFRDHLWHGRDCSAKLAAIRYGADIGRHPAWGGLLDSAIRTGPSATLSIGTSTREQLRWLAGEAPAYLITYPSIIRALALESIDTGIALPSLREVRSFGEILPDDTRVLVRRAWDVTITDIYSAQETGYLALQCPDAPGYHVMSEAVRLEVLDENGRACQPGETGQVVVTTLHNFAMPLIRYAIGDYAEVGPPCPCGRGLPRLMRIVGRQRNLILLPNGEKIWPGFGVADWVEDIPVRQLRLVQYKPGAITLQYVMDRSLNDAEAQRIAEAFQQRLPVPFDISLERCPKLVSGPNGKFEDTLCLIAGV